MSFCAGWGFPGGGIKRPRSLRSAFSQTCAFCAGAWRSRPSNARPPLLTRVLWHVKQYVDNIVLAAGFCAACARACTGAKEAIRTTKAPKRKPLLLLGILQEALFIRPPFLHRISGIKNRRWAI